MVVISYFGTMYLHAFLRCDGNGLMFDSPKLLIVRLKNSTRRMVPARGTGRIVVIDSTHSTQMPESNESNEESSNPMNQSINRFSMAPHPASPPRSRSRKKSMTDLIPSVIQRLHICVNVA